MLPGTGLSSDHGQTTSGRRRQCLFDPCLFSLHGRAGAALLAVILLLSAAPIEAQTSPPSRGVEFDQAGPGVKGYVLYVTRREDGRALRIDVGRPSRSPSGRLQLALPPLEKGTWRVELAAYNDSGESPRAKADPPEIRVDPVSPPKPAAAPQNPPAAPQKPPAVKGASKRAPEPAKKPAPKDPKKTGAMGKLWRFIVGSDEP